MSVRRWVPPVLWAALILLLTSIPSPDVGGVSFPGADKLAHGALYLVLGWLAAYAAWGNAPARGRGIQLVTLLGVIAIFAAADEWHQQLIPGRSADVRDWSADVLGAILGITAARIRASRREPIA